METTPNDLRQQQFDIKMRGYNPDDVEAFRELAANALEEARAEALKLGEENKHLKERLKHLVDLEDTLKAAVLEAQKNAENTVAIAKTEAQKIVELAKRDADVVIREAQQERRETLGDMNAQMSKLVGDINKIRFIRTNYLRRFRDLINLQLETIRDELSDDGDTGGSKKPEMKPEYRSNPEPAPEAPRDSQQTDDSPSDNNPGEDNYDEPDREEDRSPEPEAVENREGEEWRRLKEQFDQD